MKLGCLIAAASHRFQQRVPGSRIRRSAHVADDRIELSFSQLCQGLARRSGQNEIDVVSRHGAALDDVVVRPVIYPQYEFSTVFCLSFPSQTLNQVGNLVGGEIIGAPRCLTSGNWTCGACYGGRDFLSQF
jgi:hypothetical protein